jgi:uncharacterized protein YdiU (UPF0061 family)
MTLNTETAISPELAWRKGFARLGEKFFTSLQPQPLPDPYWISRNQAVARELGLEESWFESLDALEIFTGNSIPPGTQPLASVYSGHQFGQWAGQLGDGRAILLGELDTAQGGQEVQLKGAGRTPYSRMGGAAQLHTRIPVLRGNVRAGYSNHASLVPDRLGRQGAPGRN